MEPVPAAFRPKVSVSSARLALQGIGGLTLSVGAPDFEEALASVQLAQAEFQAIIDAGEETV